MRFSTIDSISPPTLATTLPLRLEQKSSDISAVLKLVMLLPVTLGLFMPFVLLAQAYASNPAVSASLQDHPVSLLQLGLGITLWAVLFALPLSRLLDGLACRRIVDIASNAVTISDQSLFNASQRTQALSSYTGVVHHVRASLSGLRHELILAHPVQQNSVLLAISDNFTAADIAKATALLGQREVPSATIYSLGVRRPKDPARRALPSGQAA